MVKNIIVLMALGMVGCAVSSPTKPVTEFSNILIQRVGMDQGGEFCKDFTLTHEQVGQYFKQAQEVTFKQFHDQYDYLPCFVEGTLRRQDQACEYSIRAGATAELNCSNEQQYFYACTTCNNLFTP